MIPTKVGFKPLKNPAKPFSAKIRLAISIGCPAALANSPCAALDTLEDCNCVLITSSGLVMQDAIVPAAPPDKRLYKEEG